MTNAAQQTKIFAFIWQDEKMNTCLEEILATSLSDAWERFLKIHPEQGVFAVFSGTDLKVEEFQT